MAKFRKDDYIELRPDISTHLLFCYLNKFGKDGSTHIYQVQSVEEEHYIIRFITFPLYWTIEQIPIRIVEEHFIHNVEWLDQKVNKMLEGK